jgi:two-component system, sensor histidine kinase and response regulator
LINLLSNAFKFTERGEILIKVAGAEGSGTPENPVPETGAPCSLHFAVSDTGSGIPPEDLPLIFETFRQAALGREMGQGTGLGLSISRHFVQLLGGDIEVESKVGQGTTFSFDLPVTIVAPPSLGEQKPGREARVIALEPGQPNYRILVVDDYQENRQLLVDLLQPLGFALREAENGQAGVTLWAEWEPHLIWMDIRMPVLDGYEATAKIKRTLQGQQTTIIAITAGAYEEEKNLALEKGCNDFIRKPIRAEEVFELLAKHLGLRYIYAAPQPGSPISETSFDLSALPPELLMDLQEAALRLDRERVEALINTIRHHQPPLAEWLATLAQKFAYDEIVTLINK